MTAFSCASQTAGVPSDVLAAEGVLHLLDVRNGVHSDDVLSVLHLLRRRELVLL